MMKLTVEQLLEATGGRLIQGSPEIEITGISTDTRTLSPGVLFVPLAGENFNGHDFISNAVAQGARGYLQHQDQGNAPEGVFVIQVGDTLQALMAISRYYRNLFAIPFVGVTGSTGKTTTKDMIAGVLGAKQQVLKNQGNLNNQIGLPMTLFQLEESHRAAVLEMGMSSFGEIYDLANIVRPKVAVITNIGMSHIEKLGSQENILKAKMEITSFMGEEEVLLINGDDPFLKQVKGIPQKFQVFTYGLSPENDIYPTHVEDHGLGGSTLEVSFKGKQMTFHVKQPGIHNVYNALAAIWLGFYFGLQEDEIQRGLATFHPSKMRLEIHEANGITVINDAYNASPDSMKAALTVLNQMEGARKIAVLGNIFEMGSFSEAGHRAVGAYAAQGNIDVIITVGDLAQWINEEIKAYEDHGKILHSFSNNQEAIAFLRDFIKPQDVVLIKGSRGMKMEEIVQEILERS